MDFVRNSVLFLATERILKISKDVTKLADYKFGGLLFWMSLYIR